MSGMCQVFMNDAEECWRVNKEVGWIRARGMEDRSENAGSAEVLKDPNSSCQSDEMATGCVGVINASTSRAKPIAPKIPFWHSWPHAMAPLAAMESRSNCKRLRISQFTISPTSSW